MNPQLPSQPNQKKRLGKLGENLAKKLLLNKGYTFICKNYHTRVGEIDLIVTHQNTLIFVEVKTRTDPTLGYPEEAVTPSKLSRLTKAAQMFLVEKPQWQSYLCRIDVIALEIKNGRLLSSHHYQGVY